MGRDHRRTRPVKDGLAVHHEKLGSLVGVDKVLAREGALRKAFWDFSTINFQPLIPHREILRPVSPHRLSDPALTGHCRTMVWAAFETAEGV